MTLKEEINANYDKRGSKAHLYGASAYTKASQNEIKNTLKEALALYFDDYSSLKMLEIGAGHGTNAYLFEELGLTLGNISFNELREERLREIHANFPNNKVYAGDAIEVKFPETYDIVFQSTVFTSILNDSDRKALAAKMWKLLNPGGIIIWYDFIFNNPKNPDVRKVTIQDVNVLFNKSKRSNLWRITLAPPIGRKVGKFYHLFNIPFLRTHILAVFQKGND